MNDQRLGGRMSFPRSLDGKSEGLCHRQPVFRWHPRRLTFGPELPISTNSSASKAAICAADLRTSGSSSASSKRRIRATVSGSAGFPPPMAPLISASPAPRAPSANPGISLGLTSTGVRRRIAEDGKRFHGSRTRPRLDPGDLPDHRESHGTKLDLEEDKFRVANGISSGDKVHVRTPGKSA